MKVPVITYVPSYIHVLTWPRTPTLAYTMCVKFNNAHTKVYDATKFAFHMTATGILMSPDLPVVRMN